MGLGEGVGDLADDLGAAIFQEIDEERWIAAVVGGELELRFVFGVVDAAHEGAGGFSVLAGDEDDGDGTVLCLRLLMHEDEVARADAG